MDNAGLRRYELLRKSRVQVTGYLPISHCSRRPQRSPKQDRILTLSLVTHQNFKYTHQKLKWVWPPPTSIFESLILIRLKNNPLAWWHMLAISTMNLRDACLQRTVSKPAPAKMFHKNRKKLVVRVFTETCCLLLICFHCH